MTIKILKIEPGKKPEIKEIEDGLKSLQDEVQGDIEAVYPFDDNVGIICNEEGKINGMALNRALYDDDGEIYDIIAGPFLIVGLTEDSFSSLDDDMLQKYSEQFNYPERFIRADGKIHALQYEPTTEPAMSM